MKRGRVAYGGGLGCLRRGGRREHKNIRLVVIFSIDFKEEGKEEE